MSEKMDKDNEIAPEKPVADDAGGEPGQVEKALEEDIRRDHIPHVGATG